MVLILTLNFNNMKKLSLLLLFFSTFFISCDNNFEEINTSPNSAEETDPNLLLAGAIINTQNNLYNMFIGGDMGLCWAQHMSKVQYNDEERYIPRRVGVMDALFNNLYVQVIKRSSEAYKFAEQDGNSNLQGVSLVLQANAYQILTDTYGPVPFTEAVNDNISKPSYDSQEVVYDGILAMLDEAETHFSNGSGTFTSSADLLYAGNVSKWRKLAASLKFKVLMRISSKRNVNTQLQALFDSGLLMSSNSDSAQLAYKGSQPDANPIYETIVFGTRSEYKVSSVLVGKLNSLADPRLGIFAKSTSTTSNVYVGNIPGVENVANYNGFSSPGSFYLSPTLPGVLLSYSQVKFYVAEAMLKGYVLGTLDEAKAHYKDGIQANLDFNGVSAGDANTYINSASVDFGTALSGLESVATQMWLALYGQGIEAWTEWRRTGIPVLSPVQNAATTYIPRRFYYPTTESTLNQANYASASSSLLNGDSMQSKVWWMN